MFESRMIFRILIVCVMLLFMVAGIYIGTKYIAKTEASESAVDVVNKENVKLYTEKEEEKNIEEEKKDEDLVVTYVDIYSECGHRKERQSVHIHGNKEKIEKEEEEKNSEYQLMAQDEDFLVFERVYEGYCTDHFKVGIKEDKICVYKINEQGKYELYQTLEIDLEMLREDIKEQLKNEVMLDSLEELFVFLEDIES